MSVRRMSLPQVMKLVEGAELIAQVTGLSISEIVNLVLDEPVVENGRDEEALEEVAALRAGK